MQFLKFECANFTHSNRLYFQISSRLKLLKLGNLSEKSFSVLQETLYAINLMSSKSKLLINISKFCYNRVLCFLQNMVNEKLVQNNFHISYVYYLLSQRLLYLLKPKPNYRRGEIIFLSRSNTCFQRILIGNRKANKVFNIKRIWETWGT